MNIKRLVEAEDIEQELQSHLVEMLEAQDGYFDDESDEALSFVLSPEDVRTMIKNAPSSNPAEELIWVASARIILAFMEGHSIDYIQYRHS